MGDYTLFARAIEFAAHAHDGQMRKGSNTPYIVHPMEAAAVCATVTNDLEVLAAAVLHDTVEDTPATIDDIQREFGARVAALVAGESEDKREDRPAAETWLERKKESIDHLARALDPAVRIVCLGDKLSNIRAMERDYNTLGDALWDRFNQKDPAKHAWYYYAISRVLQPELGHTAAWQEYYLTMCRVFGEHLSEDWGEDPTAIPDFDGAGQASAGTPGKEPGLDASDQEPSPAQPAASPEPASPAQQPQPPAAGASPRGSSSGWDVYKGLPQDARGCLDEYAGLEVPTWEAVSAALAWSNDEVAYIQRALAAGLRLAPGEACDVLDCYWPEGVRSVLPAADGAFTSQEALRVVMAIDDDAEAAKAMRYLLARGTTFDISQLDELLYMNGGEDAADSAVEAYLREHGPFSTQQLVEPFAGNESGVCRYVTPALATRIVGEATGRFEFDQAYDFCDFHLCDSVFEDDDALDLLLAQVIGKTDCAPEELEDLVLSFGTKAMTSKVFEAHKDADYDATALATAINSYAQIRRGLGPLAAASVVLGALHKTFGSSGKAGDSAASGEPPFQDFNNADGSNNDHNWEADGDSRWDDHGDA